MKLKFFILFISIIIVNTLLIYKIETNKIDNIEYEEKLLINQAKVHFDDQIKIRLWNAHYGGVYVYPKNNQKPNPYLKNNSIRDEHDRDMIKINPAWMTRQLSEISITDGYKFRITSLNPLNPKNKPNEFEKKALRHIINNNLKNYYMFDNDNKKFNYMGILKTTKSCLTCHEQQGYKLGDIRGGISIYLDSSKYLLNKDQISKEHLIQQAEVTLFSVLVLFLLYKIMKYDERLKNDKKTIKEYLKIMDDNLIISYTDKDGIITDVSKAFCKINGYKKEDCINKSNSFLMSSDTPKKVYEELWKHIETGLKWQGELKNKKANGEYYWVSIKALPIYDENSKLLGYMIVYNDITQLKEK